jgi:pimeloyl-[acyl-carrier protein] methyl ester esterase
VDLPGHGYSPPLFSGHGLGQLDAIAGVLSAQFNEPLNICGWSLGGLVALRWARLEPQQVQRLVLVASTPCFAEREDWLFGMAAVSLQQFAAELERDHAATLRRFLALQMRGSANERELLADLRSRLFSRGEPDVKALRGGLEILRDTDLRGELVSIRQPALLIAGERDKLTPPQASFYMAQALPDARRVEIAGAAHVPFLSHPEIFVEQITDFLHG